MFSPKGKTWLAVADQAVCTLLIASAAGMLLTERLRQKWGPHLHDFRVAADDERPSFQVDINRATWPELALLPGIGPTLAKRIVANRCEEGPFRSARDLLRVRGIGPQKLAALRRHLWFPLDRHEPLSSDQSQSIARSSARTE